MKKVVGERLVGQQGQIWALRNQRSHTRVVSQRVV
jgi:hypothetical protein